MTNREAISVLESINAKTDYYLINDDARAEAIDIAISALEKQIPQKPKMPLDAYWVCPTCGSKVEHPFEHCMRCGQAIDWEEE